MPVSFNSIPSNWQIPLYWVELDPSQAGLPTIRQPALLVGIQKGGTAPAIANQPISIASQLQANVAFGQGSQLAMMCAAFFNNSFSQELWCLPVAEPAGAAATGTVTVSTPPTAAGTFDLYIAGMHVPVSVAATDTAIQVAGKIVTAITATPDLPVTAANAGTAIVTLTAKAQGTWGNDITMQDSYYGQTGGETLPIGMTVAYSGSGLMAGGTGVPVFTTAISNLSDTSYEYVCMPFNDSTSLLAWETEYGFGDNGRWGWMRQLYGHIFTAQRDTVGNLSTLGAARNCAQESIMGVEVTAPSPIWQWAAAYTSKAGRALINDPARPLQSLHLEGILPAKRQNRFLISELNTLATAGIATQRTFSDNIPTIARDSTTYTKNLYGIADDAYELVTTLATLARLIRNQRQSITSKFPRHKLADDGTRFGPGQAIVTPKSIKAELVAQYRIDEFNGLVENAAAFKDNLIVERDPNDPNRVNVLYPPDVVNQLRIFAVLAQFRLQFDRGIDTAII
jgi:phage tail sheath gpL-like